MRQSRTTAIDRVSHLLAKLPGLGPRSARRVTLLLLKRKEALLQPLIAALMEAEHDAKHCARCGNLDTSDPCIICTDATRNTRILCVVEEVDDLWALERAETFDGLYHVLGGTLSALDGIRAEDLRINALVDRVRSENIDEVILALNATIEGQTTAHYVTERLRETGVAISRLAFGVPVGGELDYLDDGTLSAALSARQRW